MVCDEGGAIEVTGGRSVLICLGEARELFTRLCRGAMEIVDVRTADGRRAFVASVEATDARRFLSDPRAAGLVLGAE